MGVRVPKAGRVPRARLIQRRRHEAVAGCRPLGDAALGFGPGRLQLGEAARRPRQDRPAAVPRVRAGRRVPSRPRPPSSTRRRPAPGTRARAGGGPGGVCRRRASWRQVMPRGSSSSLGPIPESSRSCGDPTAPALTTISFAAWTIGLARRVPYSTPPPGVRRDRPRARAGRLRMADDVEVLAPPLRPRGTRGTCSRACRPWSWSAAARRRRAHPRGRGRCSRPSGCRRPRRHRRTGVRPAAPGRGPRPRAALRCCASKSTTMSLLGARPSLLRKYGSSSS